MWINRLLSLCDCVDTTTNQQTVTEQLLNFQENECSRAAQTDLVVYIENDRAAIKLPLQKGR
jgi:hypothetical protein